MNDANLYRIQVIKGWTNTIGDPELIAVGKDPAFDPKQRAFYYARVLEIRTPLERLAVLAA